MLPREEATPISYAGYVRLLLWIVVISIPIGLLTVVYVGAIHHGVEIYHELSHSFGIPAWLFTILIAVAGGLVVGLGLSYLGTQHEEEQRLDDQISKGRVHYQGMAVLLLISLIGILAEPASDLRGHWDIRGRAWERGWLTNENMSPIDLVCFLWEVWPRCLELSWGRPCLQHL